MCSKNGELDMFVRIGAHFFFILGVTLVIITILRIVVRTYFDETLEYSLVYKVVVGVFLAVLILTVGLFIAKSMFAL